MVNAIRVILVDDRPTHERDGETTLQRIESALKKLEDCIFAGVIEDNSAAELSKGFSELNPDLVILDWNFPHGKPTGAETLQYIRQHMDFDGPILIHTITFGPFEEHVAPGGADAYYWWGSGVSGLRETLKRLVIRVQREKMASQKASGSLTVVSAPPFPSYENLDEIITRHCYHPMVGQNELSRNAIQESTGIAALLTTAYDKGYINTDSAMGKVIEAIDGFADKDIPMLILGETGTGKELIARLLHFHRKRIMRFEDIAASPGRHYLAVNCGAFSETLLDSELFGSLPGAYTDATDKAGLFEQVSYNGNKLVEGGTVFLDELALMPSSSQAFLLRVLQERKVLRMGYDLTKFSENPREKVKLRDISLPARLFGPIPVNFRLVAATNENLLKKAMKGIFRLDLYYRIAHFGVKLPNLRDREAEDFNLLFQYFLQKFNRKETCEIALESCGNEICGGSKDLLVYLWTNFPWKGNIRELESFVNIMATFKIIRNTSKSVLTIQDIPEFHSSCYFE